MLRITRIEDGPHRTALRVEGRVTGSHLGELERAIAGCGDDPRRLVVDLAGVRFVDAPGAALLSRLRAAGACLEGCSPFVHELLQEESR